LAWLVCPAVAGAGCLDDGIDDDGGVDDGDPDPEPDPQAATSKATIAARATPVSAPGRRPRRAATPPASRIPPHGNVDAQLGCISRSLIQVAGEVNADPRRLQTR
jgi:hypothetical protein